jgi:iron(III) transport system permease protein
LIASRKSRASLRSEVGRWLGLTALVVAGLAVTLPIVVLIGLGFNSKVSISTWEFTLDNYAELLGDSMIWRALWNTLVFTVGGAVTAVALGTLLAWGVTSVNTPGRSVLRILPVLSLILPPLVKDPASIILFSPRTGLVNLVLHNLFGTSWSFNVFSMAGMISVAGIFTAPIAYIIMLQPFDSIDRSFLDASRMSGAHLSTSVRKVILPMILPALLSAATYVVIVLSSSFETPIIVGLPAHIPTFMSLIYDMVSSATHGLNIAAAQGSLYLILTTIMVGGYIWATRNERRYVAFTGRGHEHIVLDLPGWRWVLATMLALYAVLAFLAPLLITITVSFLPFYSATHGNPFVNFTVRNYAEVFSTPGVEAAIRTSTIIGIFVAAGAVMVAGLLSYLSLKTKHRYRRVADAISMAPIAVPHLVYSLGMLITVLATPGLAQVAYGTLGLMIVAEIVIFLPLAVRLLSSALIQLPDELIEAAIVSGATPWRTIRTVIVPIILPAILYAFSVLFVLAFRELGSVVLLVAQNTVIVPYESLTFWVSGGYPMLAALNVVALVVPLVLVSVLFAVRGLMRRAGSVRLPTPEALYVPTASESMSRW